MDSAEAGAAVDVTVVEEGVLGSGRTDYVAGDVSVAGTDDDSGDGTADDIPKFRLGDVGNTGPIPHYSPACKASPYAIPPRPLSTIKSADKHGRGRRLSGGVQSPASSTPATGGGGSKIQAGAGDDGKSSRRSPSGAFGARVSGVKSPVKSTPGDARPTAPANTPATGAGGHTGGSVAVLNLEGYAANIIQTPGGHAERGDVARVLTMDDTPTNVDDAAAAAVDVTMEEDIEGAADFVEAIEAAAAAEAIEAAADAGAAAAQELGTTLTEEFDEAFAMDAQLAAEVWPGVSRKPSISLI